MGNVAIFRKAVREKLGNPKYAPTIYNDKMKDGTRSLKVDSGDFARFNSEKKAKKFAEDFIKQFGFPVKFKVNETYYCGYFKMESPSYFIRFYMED